MMMDTEPTDNQNPPYEHDEHAAKRARTGGGQGATRSEDEDRIAQRREPTYPPFVTQATAFTPTALGPSSGDRADIISTPRQAIPLPRRTPNAVANEMQSPMHGLDPHDFAGLPTKEDENPHRWSNRRGDEPVAKINPKSVVYTDALLPRAHIPTYKFFGNIALQQEQALRSQSTTILAAVMHGGGQRFIARAPEKAAEIKSFLQQIVLDGMPPADQRTIEVYAPEMKRAKDHNIFGQPWTYFIELDTGTNPLREFLLWQEVFALHDTLSFSVYPIDHDKQPWTIMVLTGAPGAVLDTQGAKETVLAGIKARLWANKEFCWFVAQQVAENWGFAGMMREAVKAAMDTLTATVVQAEDPSNARAVQQAYLVSGKPVSDDRDAYRRWISFFTKPTKKDDHYLRGLYVLKVNMAVVDCKLCKDTTHCARDCPLPRTPGWQGVDPAIFYPPGAATPAFGTAAAESAPTTSANEFWREVTRKGGSKRGTERGGRRGGSGRGGAPRGGRR
ncbi:hypothetical protein OH77DRAFT_1427489 [Trametes cingulata]|nr:hypothetical protein OH77DRAFT_1427489 [Trametes cingulata]